MKWLKHFLLGLLSVVAALALFLAGSVAVDALTGGNRVAAVTNTAIPAGDAVVAYVARSAMKLCVVCSN
ncbi:MAG: hypothetical protein IAE81_11365 [Caldilineaceae bacterium]|nr:hypothetical protein [Caldilineaceae bacterium]